MNNPQPSSQPPSAAPSPPAPASAPGPAAAHPAQAHPGAWQPHPAARPAHPAAAQHGQANRRSYAQGYGRAPAQAYGQPYGPPRAPAYGTPAYGPAYGQAGYNRYPAQAVPAGAPRPAGTLPLPPVKTGPRIGLIVWGLMVAILGLWIVLASSGFIINGQLALIVILAAGGLTLIIAALTASLRRS